METSQTFRINSRLSLRMHLVELTSNLLRLHWSLLSFAHVMITTFQHHLAHFQELYINMSSCQDGEIHSNCIT
jgi:hypothetical protein